MKNRGLELGVGIFLLVGILCLSYLSFKLGDVHLLGGAEYEVTAKFSNVAGLKVRAPVTMAGVNIGEVNKIQLKEGQALVTMKISPDVQLEEDVIASIKTMGIIGDKYISITAGASDTIIKPGGSIHETQPPLDIESLLGKFIFGSMDSMQKQPAGGGGDNLLQ